MKTSKKLAAAALAGAMAVMTTAAFAGDDFPSLYPQGYKGNGSSYSAEKASCKGAGSCKSGAGCNAEKSCAAAKPKHHKSHKKAAPAAAPAPAAAMKPAEKPAKH
ncbi:MAG: hypothetical protein SFW65_08120 [Alphaproteobacteria bacterium]|nr:hypothetical protein [Alphaproteobacteria bacterium]